MSLSDLPAPIQLALAHSISGDKVLAREVINAATAQSPRLIAACAAMQGLLANPKLQGEILKHGGAHGGWIETSAVGWADALIAELEKAK